jgi:anti-sigma factor RsiW
MTRPLTCRQFTELLAAYLDGSVFGTERARFDIHLGVRQACASYFRTYQEATRLVREAAARRRVWRFPTGRTR